MSDKKRIDKLIDTTFGKSKGNGKITEAWQKILQEQDHDFSELNEMLKNEEKWKHNDDYYIDSMDSKDEFQLSKAESVSLHSIQPGPITLASELKEYSSEFDIGRNNVLFILPKFLLFSTCCLPTKRKEKLRYGAVSKKMRTSDFKISQYFHQLIMKFGELEALLKFHYFPPPRGASYPTNLASAQLWFVTFALAREMTHSAQIDRQSQIFFRKKFQVLLAYTYRLFNDISYITTLLSRIIDKATKQIHAMKESLTGSSIADLANYENTAIDDVFVARSSLKDLIADGPHHLNQFDTRHEPHLVRTMSYLFDVLDKPDSLRERRQLEIFVTNVTKSGWTNYEDVFTSEKRLTLLRTLLSETLGVIAKTIGLTGKIKRRLIAANFTKCHALMGCSHTFLPWLRDTKNCVNFSVKISTFGPTEYEFLRFYIFSSEIRLKALCGKGEDMKTSLQDLIQVATLSCDLLEKKFQFQIPNYSDVRPRIKFQRKEKVGVTEDSALSAFYLHAYGNVLKQSPISFRISRFLLATKIRTQERHSGVDFGVRFFNKSTSYLQHD